MKKKIWDEEFETKEIKVSENIPKQIINSQIEENKLPIKKKSNLGWLFNLLFSFILLIALLSTFSPKWNNTTFIIEGNNYLTDEQIMKNTNYQTNDNFLHISRVILKFELQQSNYIHSVSITKAYPNIIITVTENNAIYMDVREDGSYLIFEDGYEEKLSEEGLYLSVPTLKIIDEAVRQTTIDELKSLSYDVISQISTIIQIDNGVDEDILAMYMVDGSIVEIRASQISEKMPYYLTMRQEVKHKYGENQDGVYHLDVGNYFTPF